MTRLPYRTIALAVAALLALLVHQHLLDLATAAQHGLSTHTPGTVMLGPPFYLSLPYPVLDEAFKPPGAIHLALIALSLAESAILYLLYRTLAGRAVTRAEAVVLIAAGVVMMTAALGAHTVVGFDLYAYAGYAKVDTLHAAYAPPAARFPGEFGAINDIWGTPMLPSYYGPLWVGLARLFAGGAATLGGAVFAMRALDACAFASAVLLLARWRSPALAAVFALNPALYALFVATGHNEIVALAFALGAVCAAPALPLAGALLAAAAGLVKLPYATVALVAFAGRGALAVRAAWAALAVVLILAVSWVFGGADYAHDLFFRVHEASSPSGLRQLAGRAVRVGLIVVAASALIAAFARGIVWRGASWSMLALTSVAYPWYLAAALPYAALDRRALATVLILFPLAAALLENAFPHVGFGAFALFAMLLAGGYDIAFRRAVRVIGAGPVSAPE